VGHALRTLLLALPWLTALAAGPASGQAPADEPLPWQDGAPLAAPFLQLPMEAAATLAPGEARLSLRTLHSSSIAQVQNPGLRVEYQLGTTQPSLVLRRGLREGLELHLEAAAFLEHTDYLDPAIRRVESWLADVRELRRDSPGRLARFVLLRADGRGSRFQGPQQALGDAWAGLKGRLRDQAGWAPALSWRAAVKLPTGRFPYGSGVLEAGAGMLGSLALGSTRATLAADLMVPGGTVSDARLRTRPHPSLQLALAQPLGARAALLLQGSAHGSALRYIHLSEIDGWSFYVLGGVRVRVHNRLMLGFGLAENLLVTERGTDLAALLDLSWRP
jgi:hypothetical protein